MVTLLSPLIALLLVEGVLRLLLFVEVGPFPEWGATWRDARRYAQQRTYSEDDFWKLRVRFSESEDYWHPPVLHPTLGWLRPEIDPETFAHAHESILDGRRPVLLVGSSFMRCGPPIERCYEDLLEDTEFAATHRILNYAVGAYCLGQATLLLERALEHLRDLDPIVVVVIQVDRVFDRMRLGLREGPKPRFYVDEAGRLAYEAPDRLDAFEYVERHPPGLHSYLWNALVYGSDVLPRDMRESLKGTLERNAEAKQLALAAMAELTLMTAGHDRFLLLLSQEQCVFKSEPVGWRHKLPLAADELGWNGVSWIPMLRAKVESGAELESFFLDGGHPTQAGVQVIQDAIERGLRGDFDF